jgi:hypothetical protein
MNKDEDLRVVLAHHYAATDPVPDVVRAAAYGAFAWRDLDRDLAEIAADSLLVDAAVRSRGGPRLLTFTSRTHTIDVEVNETGRTRSVVGQVLPATTGELRVRGSDRPATRPDDLGRFFLDDLPAGRFSLTWQPVDGPPCNTAWIDI